MEVIPLVLLNLIFILLSNLLFSQSNDTLILSTQGIDNIKLLNCHKREIRHFKDIKFNKTKGITSIFYKIKAKGQGDRQVVKFYTDSISFRFSSKRKNYLTRFHNFIGLTIPIKKKLTSIEIKKHWKIKFQDIVVEIGKSTRSEIEKLLKNWSSENGTTIYTAYDSKDILYQISIESPNE